MNDIRIAQAKSTAAYTEALNLLNYSVVVIPVTKADKHLDPIDRDYKPRGKADQRNWETCKSKLRSVDGGIRNWSVGNRALLGNEFEMNQQSMMAHR